ncbi:MAG TPA: hypothetical protein PLL77_01305 [Pyrinomonadaceae bacterium]|nr:hypothetical protein [Pyrinomonadaceae bacterium]
MANKYDTNPLDPEFPDKAGATQVFEKTGAATQTFTQTAPTEEQTRRFANQDFPTYTAPYNGQYVPTQYQPAGVSNVSQTNSRKIEKIGLPENIVTALPYLPWFIGLIAGVVLLFIMPRSETKVRFHAAQGLAAHIGILIVSTVLGIVGNATNVADVGNFIFQVVTTIMLFVWAFKAWKGRPVHIETLDSLTNWLEEKIDTKLVGS